MKKSSLFSKSIITKEIKVIRMLGPLLKKYLWYIVVIVALGFFEALLEGVSISLFIPLLYTLDQGSIMPEANGWFGQALNQFFAVIPQANRLSFFSLCIFCMVLLKSGLSYGNGLLFGWLDIRLNHYLRIKTFNQLINVGISFIDRNMSGKLLNTLESETKNTSEALTTLVGLFINICTLIVLATLLMIISWKLTFLVVFGLIPINVVVHLIMNRVETLSKVGIAAEETLSQRILEMFNGMRTIRIFGREHYEKEHFAEASKRVENAYRKVDIISSILDPISELLTATLLIFVIFITLQDPSRLPTVLVFIFILYRLHPQISELNNARIDLVGYGPSIDEVIDLLDHNNKPYIRSGNVTFEHLKDSIRLESVSFRYGPDKQLSLNDISFQIMKGKNTAFVGLSGAGKSTIINLILRFYDPTDGAIYVDDIPMQQLELSSWRQNISVVSQDIHVFNTTIQQNIAYGSLDATEEEIIEASRQAAAHEFISALPQKYDTLVGDQGVQLSAGQKQRIALARALVRNSDILILDEATNALDNITEYAIQESINIHWKNRTLIMVAHRLSTIERADNIIVMDKGQIVEQGNMPQLVQNESLFARLRELQNSSTSNKEKIT